MSKRKDEMSEGQKWSLAGGALIWAFFLILTGSVAAPILAPILLALALWWIVGKIWDKLGEY